MQEVPNQDVLSEMRGHRGSVPGLALRKIFNYILKVLFLGRQWKALPIDKNPAGLSEIHP
jgi:hypothetical protein